MTFSKKQAFVIGAVVIFSLAVVLAFVVNAHHLSSKNQWYMFGYVLLGIPMFAYIIWNPPKRKKTPYRDTTFITETPSVYYAFTTKIHPLPECQACTIGGAASMLFLLGHWERDEEYVIIHSKTKQTWVAANGLVRAKLPTTDAIVTQLNKELSHQ